MNNREFKLKENKIYKNGHQLEVRFEGTEKENIDLDRVKHLLNKFLEDQGYHENIVRTVTNIKTILNGLEEKLLVVSHSDANGSKEIVKYHNGGLVLYEYNIDESICDEDQISIKYIPGNNLDFSFEQFNGNIANYSNTQNMVKKFTNILDRISQLTNVSAINLDKDSKLLIEIYRIFYNENPDFSNKDINIKIQTMMSILAEFGISLGDDYGFMFFRNGKMPISLNLQQKIDRLFPLGEIIDIDEPIELAKEAKNTIKIAGECVREATNHSYNQEEALITISKIIYAGRYSLSSNCDVRQLAAVANRTLNEVNSSMQLVKRIEKRIYQENI